MTPKTLWNNVRALVWLVAASAGAQTAVASPRLMSPPTGPGAPALARITGRVTDTTGAALVDARVQIVELGRSVVTGTDGRYTFVSVPSGVYSLSFAHIGYAPQVRRVTVAQTDVSLDIALKESVIELPSVQVSASATATDPLSSPQPTTVLGAGDLRTAQAPTLGETLSGLAGVHSWSTGVGIGKPVIRGLTSNRVLVLAVRVGRARRRHQRDTEGIAGRHRPARVRPGEHQCRIRQQQSVARRHARLRGRQSGLRLPCVADGAHQRRRADPGLRPLEQRQPRGGRLRDGRLSRHVGFARRDLYPAGRAHRPDR